MKRILFVLLAAVLIFGSVSAEDSLAERFSRLVYFEQNKTDVPEAYYRFTTSRYYFDPLELSYFPQQEKLQWVSGWALLERGKANGLYTQMIYLDSPASSLVYHGTGIGQIVGSLQDYYLAIDFYLTDEYPENGGSCFLSYSNGMVNGYEGMTGVLIDPQKGVYTYSYDKGSYTKPELFKILNPKKYSEVPGSFGNADFSRSDLDANFEKDYAAVQKLRKNDGAEGDLKFWRLEILREDGMVTLYINGESVLEYEDPVENAVSWAYGPIVYKGGITASCTVGNMSVYGGALPQNETL